MTRAQAVSAGLGGDIAAPTMQQDMAWAPQLRNTSCLSPQPEHADCFENPWCSRASLSNSLLHFPPTLPALQHRCSSTTSSCPILPSVSCKSHHLCKGFYSCSQTAPILPCLAQHSHPILPFAICPQPQWRRTEPTSGDLPSRYAAFTTMLSSGPTLPQQLTCLSSPPWSGDQDHQNIKAFCFLT